MKKAKRQSILIVDDVPLNLKILGNALGQHYDVKVATNGPDALSIAVSNPPDLILLDVIMPGMDGYEVCKRLKEMPEIQNIPVVFITSMDGEEDEEYGLTLGAIDYITKPFSFPIVKARVKNYLELKRVSDLLKANSMADGLTGIANRRRFDEVCLREWNRAQRTGSVLALLMIDIDSFKKYNDTYGHLAGDECLKEVARAIQSQLKRSIDLVARWGGEEFACILPETDKPGAVVVAKDILRAIGNLIIPHEDSPIKEYVTVSIGAAAMIPDSGVDSVVLLQKADAALYQAKQAGGNRVL